MSLQKIVTLVNRLAIFAILALIYWVFAFILVEVFGLRIFRENLTEIFFMSVLGILATLAGVFMLNIMLNLTRMADSSEQVAATKNSQLTATNTDGNLSNRTKSRFSYSAKTVIITLLLMFPLIAGGLYFGDYRNTQKKYAVMEREAQRLLQFKPAIVLLKHLNAITKSDTINRQDLIQAKKLLNGLPEHIFMQGNGTPMVIVSSQINNKLVFLGFKRSQINRYGDDDSEYETVEVINNGQIQTLEVLKPKKGTFNKSKFVEGFDVRKTHYLEQVFLGEISDPYFESHDGNFEMLYPVFDGDDVIGVYYFADYMRYGKYGS